MKAYCKNCQFVHGAWTRLNNGVICGRCGTRERDLRVQPVNAERRNLSYLSARASQAHNQTFSS